VSASGRIVVFGATGYTGRLVSAALVRRGARPVLAARSAERMAPLAEELGGLEMVEADVARPDGVKALVGKGDVLVSTVGPFIKYGYPAVEAAAAVGAHYLDSTGEPPFIRDVFESYGPPAKGSGATLLTAMGYDFVPGNLAGALALEEAGEAAVRVDTGYFFSAPSSGARTRAGEDQRGLGRLLSGMGGASGGTMASLIGVLPLPAFAWRDGELRTERSAVKVNTFQVNGRNYSGFSVGGSEHFGLPAVFPHLREVNAYLGWFGPLSRGVQASSVLNAGIMRIPGGPRLFEAMAERVKTSSGGPDEAERAASGSLIVGTAHDAAGRELARVILRGVNGYTFTGEVMAWAAIAASKGGLKATGARGPVEAFGLDELEDGCADSGLSRVVDA
jgi:short subunit dehydrogenase-like uncharacterized protein